MKSPQYEKTTIWKDYNMKNFNMKKLQYEKTTIWKDYNMKILQYENTIIWKDYNVWKLEYALTTKGMSCKFNPVLPSDILKSSLMTYVI